jgi:hemoglobin-like flavoprotein
MADWTAIHSRVALTARRSPLPNRRPWSAVPMTPTKIELIRTSWGLVEPIADLAATLFYDRLFEMDPAVRRLFRRTDMAAQRKNLMQTLTVVVKGIDRLDDLVPAVQALGRRHAGYGVRPGHYDIVGAALLWTLEQGLGAAFTPDVRDAWAEAYGTLATVMIDAAAEEIAPAA